MTFVHNVAYCPNCQTVAEELRETYQTRAEEEPDSVYAEGAESEGPKYVATGEDARWEEGFDSSQLVQITRGRLSELERPLPLDEAQASVVRRTVAHLIDLAIIVALAGGPFFLMDGGTLQRMVPLGDVRQLEDAMSVLLLNPQIAAELGAEARGKAVREFDERLVFRRVLNEYERLVARKLSERVSRPADAVSDRVGEAGS